MRHVLAAFAMVVLAAGCRLDVAIEATIGLDGGGEVAVTAALDADAAARAPGLVDQLRTDDLTTSGWDISGPTVASDGSISVLAAKPFAGSDELEAVLAEVGGPGFVTATFERERAFAETTWILTGRLDAAASVEDFSDQELTDLLGGLPLGRELEPLEAELGAPLESLTNVRVSVVLPGEELMVAPPGEGRVTGADTVEAAWETTLGQPAPVELSARTTSSDDVALRWARIAIGFGVALGAVVLWWVLRGAVGWLRLRR